MASSISVDALLSFAPISDEVRYHLKQTYACLSLMMVSAAMGTYFYMLTHVAPIALSLACLGCLMWSMNLSVYQSPQQKLLATLAFAFFKGASIGSLVEFAMFIDPMIVLNALLGTMVVFLCFSGSALFAKRRSYLFLGGILASGISLLVMLSLFNIFFRLPGVSFLQIYGGLLIFSGYVIVDTQLIIEKASHGKADYVSHAVELFIDLVAILVRVLIILMDREKKRKQNSNSRR
eukprot:TRINITY_DN13475_c0_g1::TRINITY_DN13475_c0_g1_i1::g.27942::m.27942 TRINITY_DN13475_c0_g1::TRINITY_DN13475_c0_g1_i1::g.27942  ORF type:complete len:249 (+),score=29.08,sp/Q9IA79/BI1_PAROL/42.47/5e-49,Bax1-I/PF01027.15/2.9e-32,DUF989/PF06181.6/15,DUF989/PF06181.6/0.54 TRINITY_DN13475_c0_g1_i1:44-748(+)